MELHEIIITEENLRRYKEGEKILKEIERVSERIDMFQERKKVFDSWQIQVSISPSLAYNRDSHICFNMGVDKPDCLDRIIKRRLKNMLFAIRRDLNKEFKEL